MLLNKNIKIFGNYFFGPLLFLWLLYSLYTQIQAQPHLAQSWHQIKSIAASHKIMLLPAVLLLMLANWSVEALKWKISVAAVLPVSFWRAFEAVLSGVSFSVSMPNRVGEYAGRVLYLPEGSRLKAIPISLVCSISQLVVTLLAGLIGLALIRTPLQQHTITSFWYQVVFWGTGFAALLLTLFYFSTGAVRRLLQRWLRYSRYAFILASLHLFHASLLLKLLSLSAVRYIIFTLQYVLLFSFFGVHVPPLVAW